MGDWNYFLAENELCFGVWYLEVANRSSWGYGIGICLLWFCEMLYNVLYVDDVSCGCVYTNTFRISKDILICCANERIYYFWRNICAYFSTSVWNPEAKCELHSLTSEHYKSSHLHNTNYTIKTNAHDGDQPPDLLPRMHRERDEMTFTLIPLRQLDTKLMQSDIFDDGIKSPPQWILAIGLVKYWVVLLS